MLEEERASLAKEISDVDKNKELLTSCKDCVFAEYEKKNQVECSLNRLEKLKAIGLNITEATDDKKDFYVVHGFCSSYRPPAWAKTVKNKAEAVKEENSLKCGVFIVSEGDASVPEIEKTVTACLKQSRINPQYIVIVNNTKVAHHDIIFRMNDVIPKEILFYVVKPVAKDISSFDCVDLAFKQAKNGYYIAFSAGYEPPANFLDKIDNLINEELNPIILIKPSGNVNGLFTMCAMHKMLAGNHEKTLVNKIEEISEEENTKHLIRKWEDIIND